MGFDVLLTWPLALAWWKLASPKQKIDALMGILKEVAKMQSVIDFLQGKKMYITAGVTFILGGWQALNAAMPDSVPPPPLWVWTLLGAFGIAAAKSAIKKAE